MQKAIERDIEERANQAAAAERAAILGSAAVEAMNGQHLAAKDAERSAVQFARSCGERLSKIKEWIGERDWPMWVRENCAFNPRTAEFYTNLSRYMADPANAARIDRMSLYEVELIVGSQK